MQFSGNSQALLDCKRSVPIKMFAALKSENDKNATPRVAAVLVVLVCLIAQLASLYLLRGKIRQGLPDFIDFYTAGKIVADGNGGHLYDLALQQQIEGKVSVRSNVHGFLPFVHPPFFALWMVVPAVFSYPAAYYVWWGCNQCFFWLALLVLNRALGGSTLRPGRLACAGLLFLPVTVAFWQGQDSLLTLLLFSLAYWFLSRRRAGLAGAVLGLGCFKPQHALLMLALLLLTWRDKRRLAVGFLLSFLGETALAVVVLGWRVVGGYPKFLATFPAAFDEKNNLMNTMPNLQGIVRALLGGLLPHTALTVVTVMLSGLLLLATILVLRGRNAQTQPEELRYSLLTASTFLASYHAHFHDMTLLLLPLLLVWNWLAGTRVLGLRRRFLAAGVAAPFLGTFAAVLAPKLLSPMFACLGLFFWGALLWNLREPEPEVARAEARS